MTSKEEPKKLKREICTGTNFQFVYGKHHMKSPVIEPRTTRSETP
jgi:hypothetical protein